LNVILEEEDVNDSTEDEDLETENAENENQTDEEEKDVIEETSNEENDDDISSDENIKSVKTIAPTLVSCPEDYEFQREFEKILSESISSRTHENSKSSSEIMIPVDRSHKLSGDERNGTFSLSLLTRGSGKGSRGVLKVVKVDIDSDLATSLLEREEKEKKEKQQFKKLTIGMNDRIDEFDVAQEQRMFSGAGRNRKSLYNHPKGVPDVDVIFGSSTGTFSNQNSSSLSANFIRNQ